ncbi:MAG: DUF3169 family protein [Lachnospiraceae bacterium]|nr:DUF3169 family protein [Lachnospiraceae bacterium]
MNTNDFHKSTMDSTKNPDSDEHLSKREDKKAMRIFIPLIIVSLFVGMFGGKAVITLRELVMADDNRSFALLFHDAQLFVTDYACYLALILSLVMANIGEAVYRQSLRLIRSMDAEDEALSETADRKLNHVLLITSLHIILSWLLFGLGFYGLALKDDFHMLPCVLGLTGFILSLITTTRLQQKVVNLVKELNPEKRGSIFDPKFQKKWLDTCDEAERLYIYKCSYAAFRTSQITCIVLLVILVLVGMEFPIGVVPVVCVCIIWGVQTLVYTFAAMQNPSAALSQSDNPR